MLGNVLQFTGAVLITAGVGLVWIPAAFIVGGVLCILLGIGAARKAAR